MLSYLCDLSSTQRQSSGMHVDRVRAADGGLIRRASDRAGLKVIDMQGDMYLVDEEGTTSWFNPLLIDAHAHVIFESMHFSVAGRFLTRRVVSPTGASIRAVRPGKHHRRRAIVTLAAAHEAHREVDP